MILRMKVKIVRKKVRKVRAITIIITTTMKKKDKN